METQLVKLKFLSVSSGYSKAKKDQENKLSESVERKIYCKKNSQKIF